MHDYHEKLPGFHPEQILHDGCRECEERAESKDGGISHLDTANFGRAWLRARAWNTFGLSNVAAAEVPMLSILWSVYVQLERRGVALP